MFKRIGVILAVTAAAVLGLSATGDAQPLPREPHAWQVRNAGASASGTDAMYTWGWGPLYVLKGSITVTDGACYTAKIEVFNLGSGVYDTVVRQCGNGTTPFDYENGSYAGDVVQLCRDGGGCVPSNQLYWPFMG